MKTIKLSVVSPEKVAFEGNVTQILLPGYDGDMGVLPEHAALSSLLRAGIISWHEDEHREHSVPDESYFITGGYVDIQPDNCTVLVKELIDLKAIDIKEAHEEYQEFLKQMDGKNMSDADMERMDILQAKSQLDNQ